MMHSYEVTEQQAQAVIKLLGLGPLDEQPVIADGILLVPDSRKMAVDAVLARPDYEADAAAPTADDVRTEASRRMQLLVGARSAAHLEIVIANGMREAVRLQEKRLEHLRDPQSASDLTAAEEARAAQLKQIDAAFEAIRAASNAMEASPPADYRDDARWP